MNIEICLLFLPRRCCHCSGVPAYRLTFSTNGRDQTSSCSRSGNKTLASISSSKKNIYHNFFTAMMCTVHSFHFNFSFGGNIYHDTIFSRQDIIIKNYLVYVAVYEPYLATLLFNPCTNHIANIAIVLNISMGNLRAVTPSLTVTAELSWLHNSKITPALHRPGARQCYDNCPHCARIVDCMQRSHCSGFKCGVLSSNFAEIRGPAAAVLQN